MCYLSQCGMRAIELQNTEVEPEIGTGECDRLAIFEHLLQSGIEDGFLRQNKHMLRSL